jgi:hypothetical protein
MENKYVEVNEAVVGTASRDGQCPAGMPSVYAGTFMMVREAFQRNPC